MPRVQPPRQPELPAVLVVLITIGLGLFCSAPVGAQVVYRISPTGSDSNSCSAARSTTSPKRTIAGVAQCLVPGDTLSLAPGTYAGSANSVGHLPSGIAGKPITVQAGTDGTVVVTAGLMLGTTSSYQTYAGLRFNSPDVQKAVTGHHLRFLRCAFQGGAPSGNVINVGIGGSYNLLEDCWVFGTGGRYKVMVYRAHHIVLRRVVVRNDGGWSATSDDPEAGIAIYESSNVSVQNCLAVDFDLPTYASTYVGPYYLTGHAGNPTSSNCEYLGVMALNYRGGGLYVDTDDGATNLVIRDMVLYRGDAGLAASNTGIPTSVQRLTSGGHAGGQGVVNWSRRPMTVVDSVIFDTKLSVQGVSVTYTNTFNPADGSGAGITHLDPRANGLLYLPAIEPDSPLKTGGANGGQRGAQILTKTGTSGSVHGEAGYNADTGHPLWPWANEARIKQEMCTEAGVSRGFCGADSLTDYVMNYLGRGNPYTGVAPPVIAPPTSVRVIR